jgi:hypothetical protein
VTSASVIPARGNGFSKTVIANTPDPISAWPHQISDPFPDPGVHLEVSIAVSPHVGGEWVIADVERIRSGLMRTGRVYCGAPDQGARDAHSPSICRGRTDFLTRRNLITERDEPALEPRELALLEYARLPDKAWVNPLTAICPTCRPT